MHRMNIANRDSGITPNRCHYTPNGLKMHASAKPGRETVCRDLQHLAAFARMSASWGRGSVTRETRSIISRRALSAERLPTTKLGNRSSIRATQWSPAQVRGGRKITCRFPAFGWLAAEPWRCPRYAASGASLGLCHQPPNPASYFSAAPQLNPGSIISFLKRQVSSLRPRCRWRADRAIEALEPRNTGAIVESRPFSPA